MKYLYRCVYILYRCDYKLLMWFEEPALDAVNGIVGVEHP